MGGSPRYGLASRQLNSLCLIDGERVPRSGLAGGIIIYGNIRDD